MKATVLEPDSWRDRAVLAAALALSLLLHLAVAGGASSVEPPAPADEPVWVEMAVAIAEPPPAPEPVEPEPVEPEPVEPEPVAPEPVEPEPVEPNAPERVDPPSQPSPRPELEPELEPEPEPEPELEPGRSEPVRLTQGLSNTSFAEGAGTGLAVPAGDTTRAPAGRSGSGRGAAVPYASVARPPKVRFAPPLEIPPAVVASGVEGRVEVLLTVDIDGEVSEATVVGSLHPAADAACVATLERSRWRPGARGGRPVIVEGVPYACRFERAAR